MQIPPSLPASQVPLRKPRCRANLISGGPGGRAGVGKKKKESGQKKNKSGKETNQDAGRGCVGFGQITRHVREWHFLSGAPSRRISSFLRSAIPRFERTTCHHSNLLSAYAAADTFAPPPGLRGLLDP